MRWMVQGPGSYWVGDGEPVRNEVMARIFFSPVVALELGRQMFPQSELTLHLFTSWVVARTKRGGSEWIPEENEASE